MRPGQHVDLIEHTGLQIVSVIFLIFFFWWGNTPTPALKLQMAPLQPLACQIFEILKAIL